MKHIEFSDAVKLSLEFPGTFQVPSKDEILQLKVGDNVKVCANDERFWVKIVNIDFTKEEIIALVDNMLLRNDLELNEQIRFHFFNIYSIYEQK
jgi:hypothetical protein